MKKFTTLSAMLLVLGVSQAAHAEDCPTAASAATPEEIEGQQEIMVRELKHFWEFSQQKLQEIDREKLMKRMAPFAVGMTQVHPVGIHLIMMEQSRMLAEKRLEIAQRQRMLLLQNSLQDAWSAIKQSPQVTVLIYPIIRETKPVAQLLTPVIQVSKESLNQIFTDWKASQPTFTQNDLTQQQ